MTTRGDMIEPGLVADGRAPEQPDGRWVALVLAALALVIIAARTYTYSEPIECDLTTYAVFGHEMLRGKVLYGELWNNYTPAIFATFAAAELLVGYGPQQFYFLGVSAAILTLLGVYVAATAACGRRAAGLWAAAIWTVCCSDRRIEANQPNTEVFINACVIWVVALLLAYGPSRRRTAPWLVVGILSGVAVAYKPIAVFMPLLACLASALPTAGESRDVLVERMARLLKIGLGFSIPCLIAMGALAATGVLDDCYEATIVYNRFYSGSILGNFAALRNPLRIIPKRLAFAIPLFVFSVPYLLGLTPDPRGGEGSSPGGLPGSARPRLVLLAYFAGVQMSIAATGHFWNHYYQLWLPALAVGAGCTIGAPAGSAQSRVRPPRLAYAIVAMAMITAYQLWYFRFSPEDWSRAKYGERFVAAERLARRLDESLRPEERFYQCGTELGLYMSSRRRPPVDPVWPQHFIEGPVAAKVRARVLDQLEERPPELIVVSDEKNKNLACLPESDPIRRWLEAQYRPIPMPSDLPDFDRSYFKLLARRDWGGLVR